jgi:hypothetical protein
MPYEHFKPSAPRGPKEAPKGPQNAPDEPGLPEFPEASPAEIHAGGREKEEEEGRRSRGKEGRCRKHQDEEEEEGRLSRKSAQKDEGRKGEETSKGEEK